MRSMLYIILLALSAVVGSQAFVTAPSARTGLSTTPSLREGSFVTSLSTTASLTIAKQRTRVATSNPRTSRGNLRMGKVSKFGIFSPAVIGAKVALGETRLNKIRERLSRCTLK